MANKKITDYDSKVGYNELDYFDISSFDGLSYTSTKESFGGLKTELKKTFHTQGGNSYGADMVVGTNDANDVVIEANNQEIVRVDSATQIVEFVDGVNLGKGSGSAQIQSTVIKVGKLPNATISAPATTNLLTSLDADKILAVDMFIQGVDGYWYPPEHTKVANSKYSIKIDDFGAGDARVVIQIDGTETNFSSSTVRTLITYTI